MLIWTDLALEIAAMVGLLLIGAGLLGRFVTWHPRCRRCGSDLRPLAAMLSPDGSTSSSHDPAPACPNCSAPLARARAVRWRPFPIRRWAVAMGAALLLLGLVGRSYGISLARRGLFWSDLASAQPLIDRASGGLVGSSPDDWNILARRAEAGWLTPAEVDALLDAIEADPLVLRPWWNGGLQSASAPAVGGGEPVSEANSEADPAVDPRASASALPVARPAVNPALAPAVTIFLTSALQAGAEPQRLARIWALLDPLPPPTVSIVPSADGWTFYARMNGTSGLPTWRPLSDWTARFMQLSSVRAVVAVRVDGSPVPVFATGPRGGRPQRSEANEHQRSGARSQMIEWHIEIPAGTRAPGDTVRLEIDTVSAPVDTDLEAALCASTGRPGPPERWGSGATPVRRTQSFSYVLPSIASRPTGPTSIQPPATSPESSPPP